MYYTPSSLRPDPARNVPVPFSSESQPLLWFVSVSFSLVHPKIPGNLKHIVGTLYVLCPHRKTSYVPKDSWTILLSSAVCSFLLLISILLSEYITICCTIFVDRHVGYFPAVTIVTKIVFSFLIWYDFISFGKLMTFNKLFFTWLFSSVIPRAHVYVFPVDNNCE